MPESEHHRRRGDLLQCEHTHGRLSAAALGAGRAIEDILALAHCSGGSSWSERVDTSRPADAGVVQAIEAGRQVERTMGRVRGIVGCTDARLIRRLLGDRVGFEACAALEGKPGARGTGYVATRFRDALEELADASKAVGPTTATPTDKYSVRSESTEGNSY